MTENLAGRTQSPTASVQQTGAGGGDLRPVTGRIDTRAQHGAGPPQRQQFVFAALAVDFDCERAGSIEVAGGGAGGREQ